MNINYRKLISKAFKLPQVVRHKVYQAFPSFLGFEINNNLLQLYRNDDVFRTAFSFNHFIEFYSQLPDLEMLVSIRAYDRLGKLLGKKSFSIYKKGATQFFLNDLFSNLDEYGLFSVALKLRPSYVKSLFYLGAIAPQFMTLFVPLNENYSSQMVHSHKHQQGHLWLPRNHVRHSGHVEILKDVRRIHIFVLNSCRSEIKFKVQILDTQTNGLVIERTASIRGYSTVCLEFSRNDFQNSVEGLLFKYFYNRSVDHKKPIIFRQFTNENWSGNHT